MYMYLPVQPYRKRIHATGGSTVLVLERAVYYTPCADGWDPLSNMVHPLGQPVRPPRGV